MSSTKSLAIFFLIFMLQNYDAEALRILGLFPGTAPSHFIPNCMLMRELAKHGHQVDVISHFPLKKPIPNYTDLSPGAASQYKNNITYEGMLAIYNTPMKEVVEINGIMICDLLTNEVFQKLLNTPKNTYDVIILEVLVAHCYIAFGKHLNAPIVGTVMPKVHDWIFSSFGVPFNPAYMLGTFSTSSQSMSFFERLKNTILMNKVAQQVNYYLEDERKYVENYFGRKLSSMNELYDDVGLLLVSSHHSVSGIMPMPPGVIEVGGMHVHDDQQELSPELKKWLDDSQDGCVYFSFGSMVRIETFPQEKLGVFYEMFENISPVRVLLKITDPTLLPPNLPKNVMTSPWLPQVTIFKHPNVKVFITHGGLIGTLEAIAYSIPMIGMPLFVDQFTNMRIYEDKGIAITLDHYTITSDSLTNAVKTILTDPSYSNNIKILSNLFHDRPMSALDTAVYWVEYTARHGNVLKSPATYLTWWQYHLLDVYGFILFVILMIFYIVKQFLRLFFKLICSKISKRMTISISKVKKFNKDSFNNCNTKSIRNKQYNEKMKIF